ncbi:hypothetical protein NUW58_g4277 [Xylaria curta]|uniref:Uncharacterized protein n=1 Tax=Xylaria curta TaxID=42375 RepID=A0ACC1P8I1_9PEZI|nr:hypothetical protein NUW58_g4277 [Xylaria curta]
MRRTLFRLAQSRPPNPHFPTQLPPVDLRILSPLGDPTVKIEPSRHVLSVFKEHDIFFPSFLKRIPRPKLLPNPYKLSVFVSQKHCVEVKSMKYFDKLEHPFAKSLQDIYIEKTKTPLWLAFFTVGGGSFPSQVSRRKIAHAVRDALAAAGYDRFGRRVPVDGEPSPIVDLYGTLQVTSHDPLAVCNAKFVDLVEQAKHIVLQIEIMLQRGKDGLHREKEPDQKKRRARDEPKGASRPVKKDKWAVRPKK